MAFPALSSLADGKTASATLEDSADGVTFAAIAALEPLTVTGTGGNGPAPAIRKVRLPSDTQRYPRAAASADAVGGVNSAQKFSLALAF